MTQYAIDTRGAFADLFHRLRTILLSYPEISEIRNAKQTSYRDGHGMVVMLRGREGVFVTAWGQGAKLQKKFPFLEGEGKVVRHWKLKNLQTFDEALFRAMIEESMILGMEADAMKQLKKTSIDDVSVQYPRTESGGG